MAAVIEVEGAATSRITGYSIEEDATPLNPADTTGGVSQFSFGMPDDSSPDGTIQLQDRSVILNDDFRGTTAGFISTVSASAGIADITVDSLLDQLVATATAKPMLGTFEEIVRYYLDLGGVTGGIYFDDQLTALPAFAVAGWTGDVWLHLKQLASIHRAEIALVSNNIVFRPIRSYVADLSKTTDHTWALNKSDRAQFVEVTYHNNVWAANQLVYPRTQAERDEAPMWGPIEAGAVLEDDIELSVSLADIKQPIATDDVPAVYTGTNSVYSIYGINDAKVYAQSWTDGGGKIELTINEDTTSVHVKITAPNDTSQAPYRIVGRKFTVSPDQPTPEKGKAPQATEVEGVDYPSFNIVGTGARMAPTTIRLPTGVPAAKTATIVGETVDLPLVSTVEQAYRIGKLVAGRWTGTQQVINGEVTAVNRRNGSGSIVFRTFGDFDAENAGKTFLQFNTEHAGLTFGDFNRAELAKVEGNFENQTMGNVSGARFRYRDAFYRIVNNTITEDSISYTAERDTMIKDFNETHPAWTFAQFNERFVGKTFKEFGRIPLNSAPGPAAIELAATVTGIPYPSDTLFPSDDLFPA